MQYPHQAGETMYNVASSPSSRANGSLKAPPSIMSNGRGYDGAARVEEALNQHSAWADGGGKVAHKVESKTMAAIGTSTETGGGLRVGNEGLNYPNEFAHHTIHYLFT